MFTDPKTVLNQLGITPGMKVAECGAGSGFYTLALARMVGDVGRVFVIDIQDGLLDRIKTNARKEGLTNLDYIHGDLEAPGGTHIADGGADAAVVSNVLFQIENKSAFLAELWRIVKPGGRVAAIDWSDSYAGIGPAQQHVVTEQSARQMFEEKGFMFEQKITVGDHHWGAMFAKPSATNRSSHL